MGLQLLPSLHGARDPLERLDQRRADGLELLPVKRCETLQHPPALRGEPDIDLAPVALPPLAPDEAPALQAIDQLDRAVVLDLEPLRQLADRRLPIRRQPPQRQEQLVLLRLETDGARCLLAPAQELPEPVPELGKRLVVLVTQDLPHSASQHIISDHDILDRGRLAVVRTLLEVVMSETPPSGIRPLRIVEGIVLCGIVSLLALLPPGLHFVTGPLGPIIGGFAAGAGLRLRATEALILGLVLGLLIGLPAPILLAELGILPHLATAALVFFSLLAAVYIGVFSMAGAYLGAQSGRRRPTA